MESNQMSVEVLETALEYNDKLDKKLADLHKILQRKLIECRTKLCEIVENKGKRKRPPSGDNYSILDNIGSTERIGDHGRQSSAFPLRLPCRWTDNDKLIYRDALEKQARALITKELHNVQTMLRCNQKNVVELNCEKYKQDLELMKNADPFILPSNADYDWDAVAKKVRRHSALECKSMWEQYECPAINKGEWSRKEALTLAQLAITHKETDWETIAKELNTNRSPFQCFIYYLTNFKTRERKKWTEEEDQQLLKLVKEFKCSDGIHWGIISAKMGIRKAQVYCRWKQCLQSNLKGRFLPEEDTVLLTCVNNFGLDFRKISQFVIGRNIVQLKNRYNLLQTKISACWTVEEDRLLVQVLAGQSGKLNYSKIVHLFPGKSRFNLRTRYQTLSKYMLQHPNADLKFAPRKESHLLKRGKSADTIEDALTGLNNKMTKIVANYESNSMIVNNRKRKIATINAITMEFIKRKKRMRLDNKTGTPVSVVVQAILSLWGMKSNVSNTCTYSKAEPVRVTSSLPSYTFTQMTRDSYFFPPTYSSCIGSRTFLRQFTETRRTTSISKACAANKDFKEQWNILLKIFKQIFVTPLVLVEIDRNSTDVDNLQI